LVSSLLDRLIDDPVRIETASSTADGEDLRELMLNVGRDLEDLLNTRRRCLPCPPGFTELQRSLVEYGIPDFTGLNMSLPVEREQTRQTIERAIRYFEPRLTNVVVTMQPNVDASDRRLRLRISAMLRTEPVPERVVFDSEIEPSTAAVEVTAVS
jgi:type VI secretion system protein ImpF